MANDDFGKSIEKAVYEKAKKGMLDQVKKAVGGLICTEHHKRPTIKSSGQSLKNLEVIVSSCCDEFDKIINSKLKN